MLIPPPSSHVQARGAVERWLLEVEEGMFSSIHDVSGRGLADYAARPRHEWVLQWPGMVVLVVTAIFWTRGVEGALRVRTGHGPGGACAVLFPKAAAMLGGGRGHNDCAEARKVAVLVLGLRACLGSCPCPQSDAHLVAARFQQGLASASLDSFCGTQP